MSTTRAGFETIASPEVFIVAAAERTKRIKLGTGVVSLPYPPPFMVAERIVQLDDMTQGRVMMGVGPGQIVKDNVMIGGDPMKTRPRLQEAMDAVIRLMQGPVLAGRHGARLISVAATDPVGITELAGHWDIWQDEAAKNGHVADRSQWRMMGRCTWPRPSSRPGRTSATASR